MMTFTDAYVVVTLLAILFTPVVLIGWWVEHRALFRARRELFEIDARRRWAPHRRYWCVDVAGSGVHVSTSDTFRPGTVANPADATPVPRYERLRDEAEWGAQR